jgi:D-amino peptidase
MRVLIMTDMEGVAGIECWEQVTGGHEMYEEARKLYTEEINAAVRGAAAARADEIIVVDCHGAGGPWTFRSLVPEMWDERAEYVMGSPWGRYTRPLEEGCDAALLVGMHAMAGTLDGVMSHTVSSEAWYNLYFNETAVGESGINAAICGHWDCPVLLVTGDEAVCQETKALLGEGLTTVAVKQGVGRFAARNMAPSKARRLIEEAAYHALQDLKAVAPYKPAAPTTITVELATPDHAARFKGRDVEFVGSRKVVSHGKNFWEAWDKFWHH